VSELPRLLWMLIDGFPHWLAARYADNPVTALRIPALRRLWGENRISPLMPVWPNCQTPPSLSTLWSGLEPLETGISGFDLPDTENTDPIAVKTAFSVRPPHVRWIWDFYAEAGHPVRLCHVPFVSPERLGDMARYVSYGFVPPVRPLRVALPSQSQIQETWRYEAVDADVRLTLGTWPLAEQLVDIELGGWRPKLHGDNVNGTVARLSHAPPLLAAAPNALYREGKLGLRLAEGGDGAAERLLASCLLQMSLRYLAEFLDSVEQRDSRLVIGYQPALDIMLHEFAGYLDPACQFWSATREAVIDELVLTLLESLDAFISRLEALAGPEDRVVVCSDHGMASLDTLIFPNTVLAQRGYLAKTPDQKIDAARSICFYHPAETGVLWINPAVARQRGVSAGSIAADLCQDLSDAPGGASEILPVSGAACSGFEILGHLRPGHCQQAKAMITDVRWGPSKKTGEHGSHCEDRRLQGIVIDLCPVRQLLGVSPIQAKDVAAAFMGCKIPQEPLHA
jgi:hypothetical protein